MDGVSLQSIMDMYPGDKKDAIEKLARLGLVHYLTKVCDEEKGRTLQELSEIADSAINKYGLLKDRLAESHTNYFSDQPEFAEYDKFNDYNKENKNHCHQKTMPKHKSGKSGKNKIEKMNDYESAISDLADKFSGCGSRACKNDTRIKKTKNKAEVPNFMKCNVKAGKPKNTKDEVAKALVGLIPKNEKREVANALVGLIPKNAKHELAKGLVGLVKKPCCQETIEKDKKKSQVAAGNFWSKEKEYVLSPKENDYLKQALAGLIKRQICYPKKSHGWRDGDNEKYFDRRVEHQFDKYQCNGHQHEGGFNPQTAFGTALSNLVYPKWWPHDIDQSDNSHQSPNGYKNRNYSQLQKNRNKIVNQPKPDNFYSQCVPAKIKHYHLDDGQFKNAMYDMGRMQNDGKYCNVEQNDLKTLNKDYYPKKFKADLVKRTISPKKKERISNTPNMPTAGLTTDQVRDIKRSNNPESREHFEKFVLDHRVKMNEEPPKREEPTNRGKTPRQASTAHHVNRDDEVKPYTQKSKRYVNVESQYKDAIRLAKKKAAVGEDNGFFSPSKSKDLNQLANWEDPNYRDSNRDSQPQYHEEEYFNQPFNESNAQYEDVNGHNTNPNPESAIEVIDTLRQKDKKRLSSERVKNIDLGKNLMMSNSSAKKQNLRPDKSQMVNNEDSTMKINRGNDMRNLPADVQATLDKKFQSNPTASFGVIESGNNQNLFQNEIISANNSGKNPINIQDVYANQVTSHIQSSNFKRSDADGENIQGYNSPDFHHSEEEKQNIKISNVANHISNGANQKKKVMIQDQKLGSHVESSENIYVQDNLNSNAWPRPDTRTYEVPDARIHDFENKATHQRHARDSASPKRTPYQDSSTYTRGAYNRPVEEREMIRERNRDYNNSDSRRIPGYSNSQSKRGNYYYSGNKRDVHYLSDTKEVKSNNNYATGKTESPYLDNPRSSHKMSTYGVDADSFRDKNAINYSKDVVLPKKSDVSAYEIANKLLGSKIIEKLNNNQTGQENLVELRSDAFENRTDITSADFNNTTKREDEDLEREYERIGEKNYQNSKTKNTTNSEKNMTYDQDITDDLRQQRMQEKEEQMIYTRSGPNFYNQQMPRRSSPEEQRHLSHFKSADEYIDIDQPLPKRDCYKISERGRETHSSSFSSFNANDEMKNFFRQEFHDHRRSNESTGRVPYNYGQSYVSSNISYSYGLPSRHDYRRYE